MKLLMLEGENVDVSPNQGRFYANKVRYSINPGHYSKSIYPDLN